MYIETITLQNFRCFGQNGTTIELGSGFTAFVGANGAGKTAVLQGLQRMFGVTGEERRLRRQDFHVPAAEQAEPVSRMLSLEVILAFPELDDGTDAGAVPEFFQQMAADQAGRLKCRLRLEATWTDDGSTEGTIEQTYRVIRTFGAFADDDCSDFKPLDRARIQLVYVPASRDGASQVASFLRGRLWRAVNWSPAVRQSFADSGATMNAAFAGEAAVDLVTQAVTARWQQVHTGGTDTTPAFRPIDLRFEEFIRKVTVMFRPDEAGRERALDDLSDGQRSLFHLAMTAAALDVETGIAQGSGGEGFQPGAIPIPSLTLVAIEEPENNLAPFYLSRIVRQIEELTGGARAQAIMSSHSASILSRVAPEQVRHFQLDSNRTAKVRSVTLPSTIEDASKFVREAVRAYPELYFARFVILGEGASEEVVLPRLAKALGIDLDPSFVAIVPLGGRHVNHLWRLLKDLDIPHATLLDLDWGREGGGWGRIKTSCQQLLALGVSPAELFGQELLDELSPASNLAAFDQGQPNETVVLKDWIEWLRRFNLYFATPLDLDYSMLKAFPAAYQVAEEGRNGPSAQGDPRTAVLGDNGLPGLYAASHDTNLRWYRYLFLGRGKPATHVRVLNSLDDAALSANCPSELRALLDRTAQQLALASPLRPAPLPAAPMTAAAPTTPPPPCAAD